VKVEIAFRYPSMLEIERAMQPFTILHAQARSFLLDLLVSLTKSIALTRPITLLGAPLLLRNLLPRRALALPIALLLALPIGLRLVFFPALPLLCRPLPLLIALRLRPPIWFGPALGLCPSVGLGATAGLFGAIAMLRLIPVRSAHLTTGGLVRRTAATGAPARRMHATLSAGTAWAGVAALMRLS
jgi:hypothetical protein